jgi:hypothetical protein
VRSIAILVALALVAAACGGGGNPPPAAVAPTTTAPPATTPPTTTTTGVGAAADKATARVLILRSADLPDGWRATPTRERLEDKIAEDELAACAGRPKPDSYTTARVSSPDFSMGDAAVSSEAEVVRTVTDFKADVAAITGSGFVPCLKDGFSKFLRRLPGVSVKSVAVEPLQVARYGDFSTGFRVTLRMTIQGRPLRQFSDEVLLGKGRIQLTASFSSTGRPFDPALRRALVAKLGARLEAA